MKSSDTVISFGCGSFLLVIAAVAALLTGYVLNIVALCKCDFEPSYKAEVIRTIGVIMPPVGAVTGYVDIEDEASESQ